MDSSLAERAAVPREKVKTQSQVLPSKIAICFSELACERSLVQKPNLRRGKKFGEKEAESALPHNLMNAI